MPLYMDIHKVEENTFTVEDIIKAHMEDLRVEQQFGVKQKMYWVNEKDQTVFCLMEGPNPEACRLVHETSHGGTACNIIEVSVDEYNLFMAKGTTPKNDLAYQKDGKLDLGLRTILMIDTCDLSGGAIIYQRHLNRLIEKYNGSSVPLPEGQEMASFSVAFNAVQCAVEMARHLEVISNKLEFRIALASGNPVDEKGTDIFQETKKKLKILCNMGLHRFIYIDAPTKELANNERKMAEIDYGHIKVITSGSFQFCTELYEMLQTTYNNSNLNSSDLARKLGMSKAQTYRKIKALTGLSPNSMIREYRLRHSLKQLKQNENTVAEIAYGLGFNSATYFTRVFRKRYGLLPTSLMKLAGA
ncbi:nickel-binding protein [Pareuzebyella sediminis]|uniref:nickel-binding protein n=1 Tax=Pareuzebyella sediminis TaxID=2607998 RepID=UPI0011F00999|nr:nickel-binding protein [Pareuzebyella sediminis]